MDDYHCTVRVAISSRARGALLLIVGLALGAGLVFVSTYVSGGNHTETVTSLSTITTTTTATVTQTPGGFSVTAQVEASVNECNYNGISGGAEACQVVLTNSGNLSVSTTGSCSLTYGGGTYAGILSGGGTVAPGSSLTVVCASASSTGAGAGVQVTGSISLSDGGMAVFSGTASS